ncbi:MAG: GntR family transcriptional regulator [Actinophytocola sp.]|nr:GntR family transcriptional regulator [Actinophytocola sp.]
MSDAARSGKGPVAYRALAEQLREGILGKTFPGGRLPTEAELARTHELSRQTVRRAMQELVASGMVYRVPGRGTFVADEAGRYIRQFGSVEDLMALSLDTELDVVRPLRRGVDVAAAGRLRLDSDVVWTVVFRRLYDELPFCLTTVHLPPDVGRLLDGLPQVSEPGMRSRVTVIGLLDTRLDSPIADAEQSITVSPASPLAVEQLGCAPQQPLLRIERTYADTDAKPVELALSEFLPEHYSYRVRLRRSLPG